MRKFSNQETDFDQLRSVLVGSKTVRENNPLYQVVNRLIDYGALLKKNLADKIGRGDKISLTEQVDGILPPANGGSKVDLYNPNPLILLSNLSGAGVDFLYYCQNKDQVIVFGRFQVTPTIVGANTELGFELPIISYFDFDYQCAGAAYSPTEEQGAAIIADVGNNRAKLKFKSVTNVTFDLFFTFGYKIIEK